MDLNISIKRLFDIIAKTKQNSIVEKEKFKVCMHQKFGATRIEFFTV